MLIPKSEKAPEVQSVCQRAVGRARPPKEKHLHRELELTFDKSLRKAKYFSKREFSTS